MPRGPKGEKRPADVIGAAVMIGKIATGEINDLTTDDGKNAAAVALGRMGGKARAEGMTAKRRKEIAKKAAAKRWSKAPEHTRVFPSFALTSRTANAPASPSNHQPVFHRLSTGLSTGCYRHCEERLVRRSSTSEGGSDEAIHSSICGPTMDCFAEPVIGRAFARPGGSQ
jgi:hypothetical protein